MQVPFGIENRTTQMWECRLDLYKFGRWKIGRKYGASEARNITRVYRATKRHS